jgi:hypothetical protein
MSKKDITFGISPSKKTPAIASNLDYVRGIVHNVFFRKNLDPYGDIGLDIVSYKYMDLEAIKAKESIIKDNFEKYTDFVALEVNFAQVSERLVIYLTLVRENQVYDIVVDTDSNSVNILNA